MSLLLPGHEYVQVGPACQSGVVLGHPGFSVVPSKAWGWFQADICSVCLRPSLLSTLFIGRAPSPFPPGYTLCPCLPRGTSITACAAALCSSASGAMPVEGVYEFPVLEATPCSPPDAPPVVSDPQGSQCLRDWLDSVGVSKLDLTAPS